MNSRKLIVLGGALLLPFFVIPISGMPVRLSREILAIWLGVGLVIAFTPSWWLRGLLALALVHLIVHPASIAYWDMMLLCTFCGIYTVVRRMDAAWTRWLLIAVCIAALAQAGMIIIQAAGLWQVAGYPRGLSGRANDAGAFLALSLPAFLCVAGHKAAWKFAGAAVVIVGVIATRITTPFVAMCAGILWLLWTGFRIERKIKIVIYLAIGWLVLIFFFAVDPLSESIHHSCWPVWQRTITAIKDKPWGYGLGSYKELFPAMSRGDPRTCQVERSRDGRWIQYNAHEQAHNEYLQMTFELGWPFMVLAAGFLAILIHRLSRLNRQSSIVNCQSSIGLVILAVGCAGFFWLHLADVAMLAIIWLALWERGAKRSDHDSTPIPA